MKDKQANRRIRLLLALFALVFAGTLGRAVWLQGVRAASLGKMAERQHHESIVIPAGRGTIFDAAGRPAGDRRVDDDGLRRPAPADAAARDRLAAAQRSLGVDANALYPQLLNRRTGFLYVKRFADQKSADAFLKKGFVGVGSYPEERRTYPQRSVASQVIGFAGTDNKGLGGLEVEYDNKLAGRTGKQTIVRDPFGRAIDVVSATPERQGRDVFTTIDHTIQANAEGVLRATIRQWRAHAATAVVLDPRTGAVLAMAQAPGYDANKASSMPLALQRNRAVTDTYEPGSTFKLVTIAGALSTGIVTAGTKFTLPYSIHVADRIIHDAEPRGTETLSVAQILSHSSNVGAITIAEKLGSARVADWIDRFGFGKQTGIDFPGESQGQVLPLDQWSGSTIGNVPIGQGIAVTPVQMASVYAAIANDGVWMQPHLVDKIGGRTVHDFKRRRIVSPAVNASSSRC